MEVDASPHPPSPENSSSSIRFKGRHSQNVCRQKFSKTCLLSLGVWGDPRLGPLLHPLRGRPLAYRREQVAGGPSGGRFWCSQGRGVQGRGRGTSPASGRPRLEGRRGNQGRCGMKTKSSCT